MAPRFLKLVEGTPSEGDEAIKGSIAKHPSGRTRPLNLGLKNVLAIFEDQPELVRRELAAEAKLFGYEDDDNSAGAPKDFPLGAVIDIKTGKMH